MPATIQHYLDFHTGAEEDGTLLVSRFEGTEEISRTYEVRLELQSKKLDIDLDKMIREPAFLSIKKGVLLEGSEEGVQVLKIHGVLSTFELVAERVDWGIYRAVLVPRLWYLTLNTQCQIFLEKSVPEIVEQVLKDSGLTSSDFEFRLNAVYPKREFVLQYQETDYAFICRWLEHEGISFHFEHGEDGEKVVFGDGVHTFQPIQGAAEVKYKPASGGSGDGGGADSGAKQEIRELVARQRMATNEVILQDYNYRTPALDLMVKEPVGVEGKGKLQEYANHYKNPTEGKALAKVRAEEIQWPTKTFRGVGNVRPFRSGSIFKLTDHFRDSFNIDLLLVRVSHEGAQGAGALAAGTITTTYSNDFLAIPADVVFRPARITPWPAVSGSITGRIDGAASDQYAEIDDEGRYKVQVPFDLSGRNDGKASRYMRMWQPYSGADYGMHFPLHKGTEVALTFTNGDPDRPMIAAAVPNPERGSPVKGSNQTQCVIKTGSDNKIVIEDTAGGERIKLSTPQSNTFVSLGEPAAGGNFQVGTDGKEIKKIGTDSETTIGANKKTTIKANESTDITGKKDLKVGGDSKEDVTGNKIIDIKGYQATQVFGFGRDIFLGFKNEFIGGSNTSIVIGAKTDIIGGATITLHKGVAYAAAPTAKETKGSVKEVFSNIKSDIGSVARKVGGAVKDKLGSLIAEIGGAAKWKAKSAKLEASGKIDMKGSEIKLEAGTTKITEKCKIDGDSKLGGKLDVDNGSLKVG